MEKLIQDARSLFNIDLTEAHTAALITYEGELLEWNRKFNLTAFRDPGSIRSKHFLDSFSCALAWKDSAPASLVDVGTGAGFPGIPLKILYPAMKLTLIESVGKKTAFCQHIVEVLKLQGVTVLTARAEDAGHMPEHREAYDWSAGRAVADMAVLAEYLLPLTKVGGAMLAQRGTSGPAEAQAADGVFQALGGRLKDVILVNLPGMEEPRYLVVVEKVAATPAKYPRKPGVPAKKPLASVGPPPPR